MRYYFKKHRPTIGDERVKIKFAWFPIKIDDEIRWLEYVTIRQRYVGIWGGSIWVNLEYINLLNIY